MEIGVWGDSITYGEGDAEALGWVGRIRKTLPLEESDGVYNRGICGDTTTDILQRFVVEAEALKPDTIMFAVGINDSKYPIDAEGNKVPLTDFLENLEKLLTQAKEHTDNILIVGPTLVNETAIQSTSRFTNEQIEIYNSSLKQFANDNNLCFIEMLQVLDTEHDLYDGLHPNAAGYEKMANTVIPFLRSSNQS